MPQYRGVEKDEIVASIEAALDFLKDMDIGPECNELIQMGNNSKELNRIRMAKTDAQLIYALHEADALDALSTVEEVLYYHAHADTDGKGLQILRDVAKWGGVGNARDFGLHPSDIEIEEYVATLPPIDRSTPLDIEYPFDQYGLVLNDTAAGLKTEPEEARRLTSEVQDLLEPYARKDELQGVGSGVVGSWQPGQTDYKTGVVFWTTRNAAQAVADAYPDYIVINSKDEVMAPQEKSHAASVEKSRAAGGERGR